MSQVPTGLSFGSGPTTSIYIAGPYIPVDVGAGVADIKPGMPLAFKSGGLTNEVDRVDSAALALLTFAIADIPERSEVIGTVIDPMRDYVYSDTETVKAFYATPGTILWARCADNTTTLTIGSAVEYAGTTGLIAGMIDNLDAQLTTTGSALSGSAILENIPHTLKATCLQARATSATESWLPVMLQGKVS